MSLKQLKVDIAKSEGIKTEPASALSNCSALIDGFAKVDYGVDIADVEETIDQKISAQMTGSQNSSLRARVIGSPLFSIYDLVGRKRCS